MSLLLLNLVYVNQADSERPRAGGGAGLEVGRRAVGGSPRGSKQERRGKGEGKNVAPFNFQQLISF